MTDAGTNHQDPVGPPWGIKYPGRRTIRFDELTVEAWQRIHDETGNWALAYTAPLADPKAARLIVEEVVKVIEPESNHYDRTVELTPSIKAMADLFVGVDDDLPTGVVDGNPTAAGGLTVS